MQFIPFGNVLKANRNSNNLLLSVTRIHTHWIHFVKRISAEHPLSSPSLHIFIHLCTVQYIQRLTNHIELSSTIHRRQRMMKEVHENERKKRKLRQKRDKWNRSERWRKGGRQGTARGRTRNRRRQECAMWSGYSSIQFDCLNAFFNSSMIIYYLYRPQFLLFVR